MKKSLQHIVSLIILASLGACNGQQASKHSSKISTFDASQPIGGGCDGCELMYIGMPTNIKAIDTSAGWNVEGQKLLVKGKVLKLDAKTPAPNVIIYYWQTDAQGYYKAMDSMDARTRRHGYIRGWVQSDAAGNYAIYTLRPAPYPNDSMPAHIHTSIKEPDLANEYYIDAFVFKDDPFVTDKEQAAMEYRGGSGILTLNKEGELQVAEHNIILGLNVPNYPTQ